MVLPTLQSYSATKHLKTPPEIIQTKQEIEADKKIEKAPARLNSAQSKWASPIAGTLSDEALRTEQENEGKLKRLEQRRSHLSEVLETEKTKYQNELISNRQSSRESTSALKAHVDSLQAVDEVTSDKPSSDHWINDDSGLPSIEQLNEKHFDEYDRQEQERQTEREIRIVQLKIILQRQMNEIKQKEEELELLKQEEESLLKEQYQLDQYEQERKQMEKPSVPQDSNRQLLRQHKAKLHKHSKEIQEQLEFDIKFLGSIAHIDEEIHLKQSEQREKFRRDVLKILKLFEQQIKLEKSKEQELDSMFQEEAAKQWSSLEQEWNHQNQSREKLIQQLLDERQEQILNRLQILKQQIKDTDEKQRTLIQDMEQARKYQLIEKQKQKQQSRLEFETHQIIEDDQNKQIQQLEQKPSSSDTIIQPKFYGRRRINWN